MEKRINEDIKKREATWQGRIEKLEKRLEGVEQKVSNIHVLVPPPPKLAFSTIGVATASSPPMAQTSRAKLKREPCPEVSFTKDRMVLIDYSLIIGDQWMYEVCYNL